MFFIMLFKRKIEKCVYAPQKKKRSETVKSGKPNETLEGAKVAKPQ